MAPRYPFTRSKPSSSSVNDDPNEAGPSNHSATRHGLGANGDKAVVVSATGRSPANLAVETSPTTLRSRITSPRNGDGNGNGNPEASSSTNSAFQSDPSKYPSPTAHLLRGKTRKKDKSKSVENGGSGSGSQGRGKWMELSGESPTKEVSAGRGNTMAVPRYDSRGYPTTTNGDSTPLRSVSRTSIASVSSAGAGVDEEIVSMYSRQFLTATPDRPSTYYAEGGGETVAGASVYPPTMSYSLSESSRDPYDPNPAGFGANNPYGQGTGNHAGPLSSLYGDSKVSLTSLRSEHSMTHFRKHDALQDSYGAFSISSKGGKRHIGDMVRVPSACSSLQRLGHMC